jgi:hypothetical protein
MGSAYAAVMKLRVFFYAVFALWAFCQLIISYAAYERIGCQ